MKRIPQLLIGASIFLAAVIQPHAQPAVPESTNPYADEYPAPTITEALVKLADVESRSITNNRWVVEYKDFAKKKQLTYTFITPHSEVQRQQLLAGMQFLYSTNLTDWNPLVTPSGSQAAHLGVIAKPNWMVPLKPTESAGNIWFIVPLDGAHGGKIYFTARREEED